MAMSTTSLTLPCSLEQLVPHGPPIRVDAHLAEVDDGCLVKGRLPGDGPFVHQGEFLPFFGIELLAQSAAALHGYLSREERPVAGFLASIDRFSWSERAKPDQEFTATCSEVAGFGHVRLIEGEVRCPTGLLCEGRLKVATGGAVPCLAQPAVDPPSPAISMIEALEKVLGQAGSEHVIFPGTFPGFTGHFPGRPVLPGILLLAAVQQLAERRTGARLLPVSLADVRFARAVLPGDPVLFSLDITDREIIDITFNLHCEQEPVATGRMVCSKPEAGKGS